MRYETVESMRKLANLRSAAMPVGRETRCMPADLKAQSIATAGR